MMEARRSKWLFTMCAMIVSCKIVKAVLLCSAWFRPRLEMATGCRKCFARSPDWHFCSLHEREFTERRPVFGANRVTVRQTARWRILTEQWLITQFPLWRGTDIATGMWPSSWWDCAEFFTKPSSIIHDAALKRFPTTRPRFSFFFFNCSVRAR